MSTQASLFTITQRPFPAESLPEVVFDANPKWVDFYNFAWRCAWSHVYESSAIPVSPYMGEGLATNKVWIWDTCFMTLFCRYGFNSFPGVESLDNFYRIIHDGEDTSILVHHPDNPPLFAWAEYLYYQFTGDRKRLEHIMLEKRYLERHYDWLENLDCVNQKLPFGGCQIKWKRETAGYRWSGCPSGMDNTPRGRDDYKSIYWVDAAAQQALSALYISKLAAIVNDKVTEQKFLVEYEKKSQLVQTYWDKESGAFMDLRIDGKGFTRVLTPASYWPILAEVATIEQVEIMAEHLINPEKLGGLMPIPSVAQNDPAFARSGNYWRGGVWLPVVYMTIKGLEKYGKYDLASLLSRQIISRMYLTYTNYYPNTIWECYRPNDSEPALNGKSDDQVLPVTSAAGKVVRQNFCGWSALGPISLFIENVIGIHHVSATDSIISWRLKYLSRTGIKNLQLGDNRITMIAQNQKVEVNALKPFTLKLNEKIFNCPAGKSEWILN